MSYIRCVSLCTVLLLQLGWPASAAVPDVLQGVLNATGAARVLHNGNEVVRQGETRCVVTSVTFSDGSGKPRVVDAPRPKSDSFDGRAWTSRADYDWGSAQCRYELNGPRLDVVARVSNTSKDPMEVVTLQPLRLALTKSSRNFDVVVDFNGAAVRHEKGIVAIANWESGRAVAVQTLRPTSDGLVPLRIKTQPEMHPRHPIVDSKYFVREGRRIAPGGSDEFRVSLVFGSGGAAPDLPADYHQYIAKRFPMALQWADRRPIGTLILADSNRKWPTNPRGYWFGKADKEDVTTDKGLQEFGESLMKSADKTIAILKSMNAQGVIVWDLEGQELPHSISYIGNPQKLPQVAPEMDRYADAFLKRFTDAGLRIGLTLRPTEIYQPGDPKKPKWLHRDVADPVAHLSGQIAYAKKRWNATIFYLDSNVFGSENDTVVTDKTLPHVMPVSMLAALRTQHPDVLIVPEWSTFEYHRFTAPFSSPNLRELGTDPAVRRTYPSAFRVAGLNKPLVESNWDTYVSNVRQGDVLRPLAWYDAPDNEAVRLIYREADVSKPGGANVAARAAQSLDSPDPIARKSALQALSRERRADPATAERLLAWLRKPDSPANATLRPFVADALGGTGEAAVAQLTAMLQDDSSAALWPYAIRALSGTRTSNAAAHAALLRFVEDPRGGRGEYREAAVQALGDLRAANAVPALIKLLDEQGIYTERLREAAVIALGKIGDPRAAPALVQHYDKTYSTIVVYSIKPTLDDALSKLTGEQNRSGRDEWRAWMNSRR